MAPPSDVENGHIYLTVLKCLNNLDVDWQKFAAEVGIKQRKLRESLKKDGYELSGGTIKISGDENKAGKPGKKTNKRKKKDEGSHTEKPTKANKKARRESAEEEEDAI